MSSGPWIENAMREIIRLFNLAGTIVISALTAVTATITTLTFTTARTATHSIADETLVGGLGIEQRNAGSTTTLVLKPSATSDRTNLTFTTDLAALTDFMEITADASSGYAIYYEGGAFKIEDGTNSKVWDFQTTGNTNLPGTLTLPAGGNIILPGATGVKIGTATSQLLGFYNATPVDQPATVADPAGGATIDAEARTAIIAVIDRLQELGLIA